MRYIIISDNITREELIARKKYILDVFNIYTIVDTKISNETIKILETFPKGEIDILFILGHDKTVDKYIDENCNNIPEKNIVVISCNTGKFTSLKKLKNKNIFIPFNNGIIDLNEGRKYGFDFDITDEEIMLYRRRKENIENILKEVFRKL